MLRDPCPQQAVPAMRRDGVIARRIVRTTYTPFGHFYETSNVICRNASLLSVYDRQTILRTFTIPRPAGLEVFLPYGNSVNLVIDPQFFNPGGFVDSSFDHSSMCGQNVTTENHIFDGTVLRCLVERNGELVMTM